MILSKAKVTSKFQITIPMRIVKKLHLNPGDTLSFDENASEIKLVNREKIFTANDLTKKYQHVSSIKAATPEDLKKALEKGFALRLKNK